MKPKTTEQIRVSNIMLRPLTDRENRYFENICFWHTAFFNGKTAHCSECANVWQLHDKKNKTTICPHCGKRLIIRRTAKRNLTDICYFCLTQRHKEYQVFRYFLIIKKYKKDVAPLYEIHEICRKFYNTENKKYTLYAKPYLMYWHWRNIPFNLYADFSIQRDSKYYRKYNFGKVPTLVASLHPKLKKFGFDGNLHGLSPKEFFCRLNLPTFESLLKMKQFDVFACATTQELDTLFPIVKIANRHGYTIKDYTLWSDLIKALQFCNKDVHNPKFICPKDLKIEHDFWCGKKRIIEQRQSYLEKLKQEQLQEKAFLLAKSKFFNINIANDFCTITPLKSIKEFLEEGIAMHHCVFSQGYYKKENSLILSVRDKQDRRLATIELDLNYMQIVQCRAACNDIPEHDHEIRELLNNNLYRFKQATA